MKTMIKIEGMFGAFGSACARSKQLHDGIKVTMGLDPEFALFDAVEDTCFNGNPINAASVNVGGCDSEVGRDGCSSIFEIRPRASENINDVVRNTRKCVRILSTKIVKHMLDNHAISSPCKMFLEAGGGRQWSLGGHIHFGHELLKRHPETGNEYFLDVLGTMLDAFLYYPIIRAMKGGRRQWSSELLKKKITKSEVLAAIVPAISRASHGGYDTPSAFRSQPWGLEYRSLPSFLADATLTKCVLAIAKGCVEFLLNHIADGKDFIMGLPPQRTDYEMICSPSIFKQFVRYTHGDKKDIFLDETATNWGYGFDSIKYISTFDEIPEVDATIIALNLLIHKMFGQHWVHGDVAIGMFSMPSLSSPFCVHVLGNNSPNIVYAKTRITPNSEAIDQAAAYIRTAKNKLLIFVPGESTCDVATTRLYIKDALRNHVKLIAESLRLKHPELSSKISQLKTSIFVERIA